MKIVIIKYIIRFLFLVGLYTLKDWLVKHKTNISGGIFDVAHSSVSFLLFFTLVNIATAILVMTYRLRKNIPYKYTDNVISGINNIYYLIVTSGVILMVLGFWGVNFKELLTSLSIVAAAIAIISKDYVSTVISGFIISFSKEINIEDYVKIGDNKGKILDINLSKLTLLNDDDDIIYIPNDKVYASEIINYTKKDIRKVSIDFELDLKYLTSIEALEAQLVLSLKNYSKDIEPDSYNLKVVDVHKEHLSLKFQFKLAHVDRDIERNMRRTAIRVIANQLKT